jgi:hypothetical protein
MSSEEPKVAAPEPKVAAPESNAVPPKKSRRKPVVQLVNPNMPAVEKNIIVHPTEKKEKEVRDACSICTNYYTPMIRKKIVCKYCTHDTCSKCVEHYLLSRHDDAHCMHCRVNYSDVVLREICTKTYLQQSYFQHRQEVLINRSRAQLPALQDEALRERMRRIYAITINERCMEHKIMFEEREQLRNEYDNLTVDWRKLHINAVHTPEEKEVVRARKSEIRKEMEECQSKIKVKTDLMREIKQNINHLRGLMWRGNPDNEENEANAEEEKKEEEEKRRFIRRCIRDDCKGFLSQAWKCGMCEWYSCSKCFAVKGPEHDSPHECTADALETAALIRKNCKPCPKCGEQIEHGGGCSQMWCISCQTPWDWNTGKIVTSGPIHNPLYYEWQRRTGGAVPRNPGDIPCGGYPQHWELIRFPHRMNPFIVDKFYEFYRICQELRGIARTMYQTHINDTNINNFIHIRFLLKDFDEKTWGRQLAYIEKKKKRDAEIQEVFAAFHMVAIELVNRIHYYRDGRLIFTDLMPHHAEELIEKLDIEIQELILMINQAMQTISISYCYSVPYIQVDDITRNGNAVRRVITVRYKNFSHDEKKRRVKKGATNDAMNEIMNEVAAVATIPITDEVRNEVRNEVIDEVIDEVRDEVEDEVRDEEVIPPRQYHYDSDSDQSVASDVQAAIVASLQDS